ncbi:MAG TPA: hypothetical protein VKR32_09900 [Puia sp.]|nr:hypothetical protein [Puia sp.]
MDVIRPLGEESKLFGQIRKFISRIEIQSFEAEISLDLTANERLIRVRITLFSRVWFSEAEIGMPG